MRSSTWNSLIAMFVALVLLPVMSLTAQQVEHRFQTADNAPGVAGRNALIANPTLAGHVQAVRVIGPNGCLIGMYSGQGLESAVSSDVNVGMMVGHAYRLKVTHIPDYFGVELYPSIELLDRLYPPVGMASEFPVQIVLTENDLAEAIDGKLVTKVIYLEDPRAALPFEQSLPGDEPAIDVSGGSDPYVVAERLGKPMAIVRIGSRVPTVEELGSPTFDFMAPGTSTLPTPLPVQPEMRFYDQFNGFQNRLNDTTNPRRGATNGAPARLPRMAEIPYASRALVPPEPNQPPVVSGSEYRRANNAVRR